MTILNHIVKVCKRCGFKYHFPCYKCYFYFQVDGPKSLCTLCGGEGCDDKSGQCSKCDGECIYELAPLGLSSIKECLEQMGFECVYDTDDETIDLTVFFEGEVKGLIIVESRQEFHMYLADEDGYVDYKYYAKELPSFIGLLRFAIKLSEVH